MSQNKKWSSHQKLEIALLAVKGDMTITELCQTYLVAPSQVHAWKKLLLDEGAQLFERTRKTKEAKTASEVHRLQTKLYEKIGQLTVERDFLKKAWGKLHGPSGED